MANGVYWVGTDNNIWLKDNQGVRNVGTALKTYDQGFDAALGSYQGYKKIADPNPVTPPRTLPSIYSGGGGGAPAPVYAPKLDVAGINAQARKAAEGAVNPYYTKVLNEFLTQQAVKRQQQQTQAETNIKNLEDQLNQTMEQNQLTGQRTTQDVAQNEAQIAQSADQFQTDTGQAFNQVRLQAAKQSSTGGLGQQKLEAATKNRNTQESRQVQQFQQAKTQQELFKSRTFEDLAKSGELAKQAKEKGVKQTKFDLENYLQGLSYEEQQTRNQLEQERLARIASEQQNQAKLRFNQYLAGIANPAQYAAAVSTYGGLF